MGSKQVNSNCPEFGYELLSAVPYAYNLFLKVLQDQNLFNEQTFKKWEIIFVLQTELC